MDILLWHEILEPYELANPVYISADVIRIC